MPLEFSFGVTPSQLERSFGTGTVCTPSHPVDRTRHRGWASSTRSYAQAIKVAVLDDPGKASVMYTGCCGIGASRIVAAPCSAPHRGFERGSAAGSFKHRARRAAEAEALTREHVMAATEWRTANGKARNLERAGFPIRHSPFAIRRMSLRHFFPNNPFIRSTSDGVFSAPSLTAWSTLAFAAGLPLSLS